MRLGLFAFCVLAAFTLGLILSPRATHQAQQPVVNSENSPSPTPKPIVPVVEHRPRPALKPGPPGIAYVIYPSSGKKTLVVVNLKLEDAGLLELRPVNVQLAGKDKQFAQTNRNFWVAVEVEAGSRENVEGVTYDGKPIEQIMEMDEIRRELAQPVPADKG